jgi:TonB family protein
MAFCRNTQPRVHALPRRYVLCLKLLATMVWAAAPVAQAQTPPGAEHAQASPVLTRPPVLLHRVDTVYPQEEKSARRDGTVLLSIDIDAVGHVQNAQVVTSAGAAFDAAALAAVRQFVFSPAEIDGQPAAVQIDYTEHFVFAPPAPTPAAAPAAPKVAPKTLCGRVLQRASRVAIGGAGVIVSGDAGVLAPVVTDADGRFCVAAGEGNIKVEVRDVGHHLFATTELIKPGEQLQVSYYLLPKAIGAFETVVRGAREKKEVTRRTLHRAELESVPGSYGDPLRVILDLPGLSRTAFSVGGLIVRGSASTDTGTYFDGVQLPLIFHFGGGPSVVNPEFLDRIDFFPGGFGGRYGRAIGGVLDIASRAARPDRVRGSAKIDLIDTGVFVSVPLTDSLLLSLAARRSYIELPLKLVLKLSDAASTIVPSYYDYQARLSLHKIESKHQFDLMVMGSDDLLSVVSTPTTGAQLSINAHQGFQRLSGTWRYAHDAFSSKALVFAGFDENSFGIGQAKVDSPAFVLGMREDLSWRLHSKMTLTAGIDAQWRRQDFALASSFPFDYVPFPGSSLSAASETINIDIGQLDVAQWVELEVLLPYRIRLVPSVRLDTFNANGATQLALGPRLSVRREFGSRYMGALKASYGVYSEQPSVRYSNTAFGNPLLPLQQANQLSAGYEQRLADALNIDATLFWSHRYGLSVPTTAVVNQAGRAPRPLYQAGTGVGDAYGLEVFLRHDLTQHIFGWLAYTLSWSQQRDDPSKKLYPTQFDQRHILTAMAQYKFNNGWAAGGRFRVVSGSPATAVSSATYSADSQSYTPSNATLYGIRQPVFHQLDVRVDKVWLFNTWQIGLYLDVQNVYNRQNADFVQYDYRYAGKRTVPDVPILPTLGVKGVF